MLFEHLYGNFQPWTVKMTGKDKQRPLRDNLATDCDAQARREQLAKAQESWANARKTDEHTNSEDK